MNPILLCYPKCGTCRKAEKWMKDHSIAYNYRAIKEENPTKDELQNWIRLSGLPVAKFFNTSGLLYKEQNMKDKVKILSHDELVDILASDGMMVKRPVLLAGDKVMVGFSEEDWRRLFL